MKTTHRIQEALADRFSFVQYPNIRPSDAVTRQKSRTGMRFKYPMTIGQRIDLLLISLVLLLLGLAGLGACILFIYLFLF